MALPLEKIIMEEIGLGPNYRWFNGSGSCEYIRQEAARRLPEAIRKHHQAADGIVLPNGNLMRWLQYIANVGDDNQYVLTKTWQAASYIIAAHIHADSESATEIRAKRFNDLASYIKREYLSPDDTVFRKGKLTRKICWHPD